MNPEDSLVEPRRRKAAELLAAGVEVYGGRFDDARAAAEVLAGFAEGDRARVAGRIWLFRRMGRSAFAHLRDSSGQIQLYFQEDVLGADAYGIVRKLDLGDIVGVDGELFRTRTGEPTLRVQSLTLLCKALRPPPEKWHGLADVELRYRRRYLDLMARPEAIELFRTRARIVSAMRAFLEERGFLEVETPMMQPHAGGALARPFRTRFEALDQEMCLRIAPELYLKRLLVGGFERVYELNRNFRNEGLSRRHNPEFTMLEVYQAYGDCRTIMELTESLIVETARRAIGTLRVTGPSGAEIDLTPPWPRVEYRDLVRREAGADWFDLDRDGMDARARGMGLEPDAGAEPARITQEVYEKRIEPGLTGPVFVVRLDAELIPLARRCADDDRLVDVYELVIDGQEISPGYSELNDPGEQRLRFEAQRDIAEREGMEGAVDEDFLRALEHGMPPAGGMGLGVDRLVMTLTGESSIRDVILFPQLRNR